MGITPSALCATPTSTEGALTVMPTGNSATRGTFISSTTMSSSSYCSSTPPPPIVVPEPVQIVDRKEDYVVLTILIPLLGWIPLVILCCICKSLSRRRRVKKLQAIAELERMKRERAERLQYELYP
ncbi:hypothetical protein FRC14_000895 [Serendipita sp. 396]|nr:hypothetical protein FRC14_000895 [Serendipita sp. 396]